MQYRVQYSPDGGRLVPVRPVQAGCTAGLASTQRSAAHIVWPAPPTSGCKREREIRIHRRRERTGGGSTQTFTW